MKKFLLLSLCLLVCSCASMLNLDNRIQKLELGMTKREVVRILDNNYNIELSSLTPNGRLEVWHFQSEISNDYIVKFLDGKLVEFHKYREPVHHIGPR